jgi:hypothetical protein
MRGYLVTLVMLGCSGGGDDGEPTDPVDPFAQFINVEVPASGSYDCFVPSADPAAAVWNEAQVDPAKQVDQSVSGLVEDFEDDTPVAGATVALFKDDTVDTPDETVQSSDDGAVSATAKSCSPIAYKVTTVGGPVATKTTYKAHQIYGFAEGGGITDASFLSVSDVTYQLIPAILGVEVQSDLAIIAGTAYDCTRDSAQDSDDDAGKIEGVQVVVYDADGNIPETLQVNYFVESFPAREQAYTSADGLWVASNVPPGDLRVEMWGNLGSELVLLGATELHSEADSINIANIFAGYGDGVKYPSTCAP